jgi:hypothetical protein
VAFLVIFLEIEWHLASRSLTPRWVKVDRVSDKDSENC